MLEHVHVADLEDGLSSTPDIERNSEPWTSANEDLLRCWCEAWSLASEEHACEHHRYHRWQTGVALPSVALPLILSPISNTYKNSDCDGSGQRTKDVLIMFGFIACSVLSATNVYFHWGITSEAHLTVSRRYSDLVSDTEEMLAKLRCFRLGAAVSLRTLKDRSDHLLQFSPPLPYSSMRRKKCLLESRHPPVSDGR
jgi:hypothetical protein